mmetsp:Transcript_9816/g.18465  ORF Transcript_9816/g.18465 Transcript_9816/m.18465 type:complete len:241 (+) Transcript_9816:1791-2513(+)
MRDPKWKARHCINKTRKTYSGNLHTFHTTIPSRTYTSNTMWSGDDISTCHNLKTFSYLDCHAIFWDINFNYIAIPVHNHQTSIWIDVLPWNNFTRIMVDKYIPSQSCKEPTIIVPTYPGIFMFLVIIRIHVLGIQRKVVQEPTLYLFRSHYFFSHLDIVFITSATFLYVNIDMLGEQSYCITHEPPHFLSQSFQSFHDTFLRPLIHRITRWESSSVFFRSGNIRNGIKVKACLVIIGKIT